MAGVNKVILLGNLGKDPEVRHLESGVSVASFTLATSETYKDRNTGERKTITEWHNIVLWRGLADVAEKYLQKGSQVYIEGKIRTRSWEDQDKNIRYTTEIVADQMTMLGRAKEGGQYQDKSAQPPRKADNKEAAAKSTDLPSGDDTDDLPF